VANHEFKIIITTSSNAPNKVSSKELHRTSEGRVRFKDLIWGWLKLVLGSVNPVHVAKVLSFFSLVP
jgi:hypothetical protein